MSQPLALNESVLSYALRPLLPFFDEDTASVSIHVRRSPGMSGWSFDWRDADGNTAWPDAYEVEDEVGEQLAAMSNAPEFTAAVAMDGTGAWTVDVASGEPHVIRLRSVSFPDAPDVTVPLLDSAPKGWTALDDAARTEATARLSARALAGNHAGAVVNLYPHADGPVTQLRPFVPGWVPVAESGDGAYAAVDTVPGSAGTAGQVIEIPADLQSGIRVLADSLEDFAAGKKPTLKASKPGEVESQFVRIKGVEDVRCAELDDAARLTHLVIREAANVDLAGLNAPQLQELALAFLYSVDLAPLAGSDLPSLRRLSIEHVDELVHPEALAELSALEHVHFGPADVAGFPTADTLAVLAAHPRLACVSFDARTPVAQLRQVREQLLAATSAATPLAPTAEFAHATGTLKS